MKYKADDVLKPRIYFIAKKIFYDLGYEKTTIRQISKEAGVSVGLLNYYFVSKEKIAAQIYEEIKDRVREIIISNIEGLSNVSIFVYTVIFDMLLLLDNDNLRSFYKGFCGKEDIFDDRITSITNILKRYNRDLKSLTMNAISLEATKNKLLSIYDRRRFEISKKEIIEYLIEFYSVRLKIDESVFGEMYDNIINAYMRLKIEVVSGFEVKIGEDQNNICAQSTTKTEVTEC